MSPRPPPRRSRRPSRTRFIMHGCSKSPQYVLRSPFVGSKLHPRGSLGQWVKVPGSQHPSAAGSKVTEASGLAFPPRNQDTHVHPGQAARGSAALCLQGCRETHVYRFGSGGKVIRACRRSPLRHGCFQRGDVRVWGPEEAASFRIHTRSAGKTNQRASAWI